MQKVDIIETRRFPSVKYKVVQYEEIGDRQTYINTREFDDVFSAEEYRDRIEKALGKDHLIGYRFIVSDRDVYIVMLDAKKWRYRYRLNYDALEYMVLSIVNARTFERADKVNGSGVRDTRIEYKVGDPVSLPEGSLHGTYFFRSVELLFSQYLFLDENNIPYYDKEEVIRRNVNNVIPDWKEQRIIADYVNRISAVLAYNDKQRAGSDNI